jgi:hypothetical protein
MPYHSELSAELSAVFTTYFGDVTIKDIEAASGNTVSFLKASEKKLYVLTDVTEVKTQPNRIVEIWQFARAIVKHKHFAGWLVIGVNNPIMSFIIKMIAKFGNILYQEFETREAGIAYLKTLEKA